MNIFFFIKISLFFINTSNIHYYDSLIDPGLRIHYSYMNQTNMLKTISLNKTTIFKHYSL